MTPSGIEHATFWLVAQCLTQMRHRAPPVKNVLAYFKLDVHGSVHRNIKLIERTNKMQPCSRIYYSSVS